MTFRGVLFRVEQAAGDGAFHVVAPDARLCVPTVSSAARAGVAPFRHAEQHVVVDDAVTNRLLTVAHYTTVSPLSDSRSVLWVTSNPFPTELNGELAPSGASDMMSSALACASAIVGSPAVSARTVSPLPAATPVELPGGRNRVCFCFYFRSDDEFEQFERVTAAYRRLEQFSLLRSSVLIELEVQHDLDSGAGSAAASSSRAAQPKAESRKNTGRSAGEDRPGPQQNGARDNQSHSTQKVAKMAKPGQSGQIAKVNKAAKNTKVTKGGKAAGAVSRPKPPPGVPVSYSRSELGQASATRRLLRDQAGAKAEGQSPGKRGRAPESPGAAGCILCPYRPKAGGLTAHPFVLKDGHGNTVQICKICLQKVLQRRVNAGGSSITSVACCALCAEQTTSPTKHKVKQCSHEMCKKTYCDPCIQKLIGRTQAHKAWRTRRWLCTNCTTLENDPSTLKLEPASPSSIVMDKTTSSGTPDSAKKNKKRKLHQGDEQPSKTSEMAPLDYAVSYFEFLTEREEAGPPEDESEDVCFCCKDGGDVLECDWKGLNGSFARCPKVYHDYCLGYGVPDEKTWFCPRHRCQECGIIAHFSCRFCVTSYCENHLPESVKNFGPALKDIPNSTYVLCERCERDANEAMARGKLSAALYSCVMDHGE